MIFSGVGVVFSVGWSAGGMGGLLQGEAVEKYDSNKRGRSSYISLQASEGLFSLGEKG